MTDQKTLFSALKKCNQIGKKLSYDGTYIMVSGMMMGYTWQEMDETEARGLCVSFIESKLLNKLDALPYIGLKINGNMSMRDLRLIAITYLLNLKQQRLRRHLLMKISRIMLLKTDSVKTQSILG